MAYDGSLNFDTKVNTDGFGEGISTLNRAIDRLSHVIDRLSKSITGAFQNMGNSAEAVSVKSDKAATGIDGIGQAAEQSEAKVKSLQEQMDAISIHTMQDSAADVVESAPVSVPMSDEGWNFNAKAIEMVFGESAAAIRNYADAVAQYGAAAGMAMNQMETDSHETAATLQTDSAQTTDALGTGTKEAAVHVNGMKSELEAAEGALKELQSQGFYFGDSEYDAAYVKVQRLKQALADYKQKLLEIGNSGAYVNLKDSIINAVQGVPKLIIASLSKIPSAVSRIFSAAGNTVKGFGHLVGKSIQAGMNRFVSGVKKMGNASQKACKPILRLSNMLKLMVIRMALRGVIQGAREGLENLAKYSDETNRSMSSLMSATTRLKNSFATAAAPILNAMAPALTTLINLLSKAATYMAQLISAFTGKSTFVRAKEVQQDYAASLENTGSAAKKAGKDAKKALAPFDELTQMQKDSSDDSGAGGLSPSDMFETVEIESKIADFAKQVKDLFAAGDYEGIGAILADRLNAGVKKISDFIDWDNCGEQVTKFVTGFTRIFNSLVENFDWYALGEMFGKGINTIVNTLNLLITGIDWQNLGKKIAEGVNGLFREVDWGNLGQLIGNKFMIIPRIVLGFVREFDWSGAGIALAEGVNGIVDALDPSVLGQALSGMIKGALDTINNFLENVDWQEIGRKIQTFLVNIDWLGIISALARTIGGLAGAVFGMIAGLFEGIPDIISKYFKEKIQECGGNVVQGLFKGILDALANVGKWIVDNIFKPILNGFMAAFGIHSPSTVMAEMGNFIVEGLYNGITDKIKGVIDLCSGLVGDIQQVFNGLITFLTGVFSGNWSQAWQGLKDIFKGTFSGIITIAERALNYIVDKLNSLSFTVPSWVPGMGGKRFAFNIPRVTLPRLATGTVVPPRAGEFAAILGDNNRETEVVSPLSTMKQAFKEAITEMGGLGGGEVNVYLEGDAEGVFRLVRTEHTKYKKQTGKPAFT